MNIDIHNKLTKEELELFSILKQVASQTGTTPRVAGGWVRDKILGFNSDDIDIMVDNMSGASFAKKVSQFLKISGPHVIQENPDKSKHIESAKSKIPLSSGNDVEVDFVQARKEIYSDESRIPSVDVATPEEDAMRRDLTINALFYNIVSGTIEDFTGNGIKDLITNTIRTPGDPYQRFLEDPLRILRAIRFAAKYNGVVDEQTLKAMSDESLQEKLINIVSQERMGQEIVKMLKNKNSDNSIKIMKDIGLFQRVLSKSLEGTEYEGKLSGLDMDQENKHHQLNLWNHTFRVIKNVLEFNPDLDEEKRIIMLLAALTHDLGKLCEWIKKKSEDGSSTSYVGHEDESAKIVNHLLKFLKLDQYIKPVAAIAESHMHPHALQNDKSSEKALRKFVRRMGEKSIEWLDVFNISIADACAKSNDCDPSVFQSYIDLKARIENAISGINMNDKKVKPILNGLEIMQHLNIKEGPWMKKVLAYLLELQDENPRMTKDEAKKLLFDKFGGVPMEKIASHTKIASECPLSLLQNEIEEINSLFKLKKYYEINSRIKLFFNKNGDDIRVRRLAAKILFESLCLRKRNNKDSHFDLTLYHLLLKNFKKDNMDNILNAYLSGIWFINGQLDKDIFEKICKKLKLENPKHINYVVEKVKSL